MTNTCYSNSSTLLSPHKFRANNPPQISSVVSRIPKQPIKRIRALSSNNSLPDESKSSLQRDVHQRRSSLESLFCYDKAIPEEKIEKPVGLSVAEKVIGDNPCCPDCQAKGAMLCITCSGTGLYVDSILESQGIIVKVRCLGCGGSGNIMCSECHGRGHLGSK